MEATRAQAWVDSVSDGASLRTLAAVLDINHVTVRRRIDSCDASLAVHVARHFGADPVEGLIAFGVLTEDEAKRGGTQAALADASDLQLAEEMVRRIKAGTKTYDDPVDVAPSGPRHQPTNQHPISDDPIARLAQAGPEIYQSINTQRGESMNAQRGKVQG